MFASKSKTIPDLLGLDAIGIPVTGRKIEVNPGIHPGYWRDIYI